MRYILWVASLAVLTFSLCNAMAVEATPTPSPSPLAAAPVEAEASASEGYGKTMGVAGPVLIAPAVTLLGLPTPFRVGLELRGFDYLGLGFDYGFLPTLTFSDVKIKYTSWRITGRAFPFKGAFFVGLAFGKQTLTGTGSNTVQTIPVSYSLELATTILAPHIGWRWTWNSGFFFGMELGVQLVSNATSTVSTDAPAAIQSDPDYLAEKAKVEDEGRKLGNTTLPHFGLIQVGYYF